MLHDLVGDAVRLLLLLGRVDQQHPARHCVHVDVLGANANVNNAGIQVLLVALYSELVQGDVGRE